ncbi:MULTISPECIES: hypothetical protein [Paraliobacillus]|uniref:hypothetical protein n=1 Tax=Paraliobacillus TaxID=200903 RepID=UPI000DD352EE|nr:MULTISPECIES: hypothetical protein [Paraliobacillus]
MSQIRIGLIAAPELPQEISNDIINQLPDIISKGIDGNVEWEVEIVVDPLTGAAETAKEVIDEAIDIKQENNWDYAICLTDLPLFAEKDIVLSDINFHQNIARISLPAFGFTPMRSRVKKTFVKIVREMYEQTLNEEKDEWKRPFRFSPIRRITAPVGMNETDIRYVLTPRINGLLRLVFGMTRANRPWSIISSFKPIIAIAFATGAYVLVFPTLWELSAAFTYTRLISLMFVAVLSMVIWMITSHHLWEGKASKSKKKLRRLYNEVTISTLLLAVLFYYVVLFIIFLMAVSFFVPPELFSEKASLDGPVDLKNFIDLAWLATSVATLAGSIGAGVENEELVRNVAYGYRQNRRYNELYKKDS